jgi:hypothetical protein
MTIKIRILILCLLTIPALLKAQKVGITLHAFPSSWYNGYFEPAVDGGGLAVSYAHGISDKLNIVASAEYDLLRERNECYAGIGATYAFWGKGRFRILAGGNLLNGISLYNPKPLYTGGAEALAAVEFSLGKKTSLSLNVGARYTFCPAYKGYGVWRHNSWPVGLEIRF